MDGLRAVGRAVVVVLWSCTPPPEGAADGVDADVIERRPNDGTVEADREAPGEAGVPPDAIADVGPVVDGADATLLEDGGEADAVGPVDGARPIDGALVADAAPPFDAAPPVDAEPQIDVEPEAPDVGALPEPPPAEPDPHTCRSDRFTDGVRTLRYELLASASGVIRIHREGLACPPDAAVWFERMAGRRGFGPEAWEPFQPSAVESPGDCFAFAARFEARDVLVHVRTDPAETYGWRFSFDVLPAHCGDGVVDASEGCDDGNVESGDGCDAACRVESVCGDGVVEGAEVCDGEDRCSDDCRSRCGDGEVQPGEECDGEEGCTADCRLHTECGDGRVRLDETCDTLILGRPCDSACTYVDHDWIDPPAGFQGRVPVGEHDIDRFPIESPGELILRFDDECPELAHLELSADGAPVPLEHITGRCPMVVRAAVDPGPHTLRITAPERALAYTVEFQVWACFERNEARGAFAPGGRDYFEYEADAPFRLRVLRGHTGRVPGVEIYASPNGFQGDGFFWPLRGDPLLGPGRWTIFTQGSRNPSYTIAVVEAGPCGDGVVNEGEICDDGNDVAGDGCDPDCRGRAVCGDGVAQGDESCDDGGRIPGDGCDERCQVELERCGDGVVDPEEQCDDDNIWNGDGCDVYCTREVYRITDYSTTITGAFGRGDGDEGCDVVEFDIGNLPPQRLWVHLDDGTCDEQSSLRLGVPGRFSPNDSVHAACEPWNLGRFAGQGFEVCGPRGRRYSLTLYQEERIGLTWFRSVLVGPQANRVLRTSSGPYQLVVALRGDGCEHIQPRVQRLTGHAPQPLPLEPRGCHWFFDSPGGVLEILLDADRQVSASVRVRVVTDDPLVISEIMADPPGVDEHGEWFEVRNVTEAPIDLAGYVVGDQNGDRFVVDRPLLIPPGEVAVFGRHADLDLNGGVEVDFEYGDQMVLGNQSDSIWILDAAGAVVTWASYAPAPAEGESLLLWEGEGEFGLGDGYVVDPRYPSYWEAAPGGFPGE